VEWSNIISIGPNNNLHLFGVKLVGANEGNAEKLILSLIFLAAVFICLSLLRIATGLIFRKRSNVKIQFWVKQGLNLAFAFFLITGLLSIWFDDPTRLTTAMGLVTAGLAFALQKLITSISGYFIILRGQTFNVGDRIVMGGVRGDVIALGFTQTTIMEMGQPPSVQSADPAVWIKSRQFTGRIVTVPNNKIFDEPVYNYTKDFDFIWEEVTLPISYQADRAKAESILMEAAENFQVKVSDFNEDEIKEFHRRYFTLEVPDLNPSVYFRLTDNWLELTVRFVARAHGVRGVKDKMSRFILKEIEKAGIGIASATYEIVGLPPIHIESLAGNMKEKARSAAHTDPKIHNGFEN